MGLRIQRESLPVRRGKQGEALAAAHLHKAVVIHVIVQPCHQPLTPRTRQVSVRERERARRTHQQAVYGHRRIGEAAVVCINTHHSSMRACMGSRCMQETHICIHKCNTWSWACGQRTGDDSHAWYWARSGSSTRPACGSTAAAAAGPSMATGPDQSGAGHPNHKQANKGSYTDRQTHREREGENHVGAHIHASRSTREASVRVRRTCAYVCHVLRTVIRAVGVGKGSDERRGGLV
jgi:hypothetical protein